MTKWYKYDDEVAALHARGLNRSQIARAVGTTIPSVTHILYRLGLPTPQDGRKSRKQAGLQRWQPIRERFLAECARLGLPPQVTLAREMGVSRQRAHQIICDGYSAGNAIPAAERFIERVRHVKPKPTPAQVKRAEDERKRAEREAKKREWADLVATVDAMTRGYGKRHNAASEMGLHVTALSSICSRYRSIGETTAAKLAAWVERHQS